MPLEVCVLQGSTSLHSCKVSSGTSLGEPFSKMQLRKVAAQGKFNTLCGAHQKVSANKWLYLIQLSCGLGAEE